VELFLSPGKSKIVIDPYTEGDLIDLLNIFCDLIYNKLFPNDENKNHPGKQVISPELNRAIRNLVNLHEGNQEVVENGKKIRKRYDKCEDEYKKHNNLDGFKASIIEKANIPNRNTVEISYSESFGDERIWLKKTFENINSAKIPAFSLPKKIYVHLSTNIVKESLFNNFETIIDSKGLDANENRKDIDAFFKDPKTICVVTTGYKDAPDTNIRNLLENHFYDKLAYLHTKTIMVVLPQKGMPEQEDGAEGNREEGIDIRRSIIQGELNKLGVCDIPDSNIVFFDAHRFHTTSNNTWLCNKSDDKKINDDREDIVLNLLEMVERHAFYLMSLFLHN
jgi:hypothetical protein